MPFTFVITVVENPRQPHVHCPPVLFLWVYDTSIFSAERHRIDLWGCYLLLFYTGARSAELVESEKNEPDNMKKLFHRKAVMLPGDDADNEPPAPAPDAFSKRVGELLEQEPAQRGRSKSLCYEDILLMITAIPSRAVICVRWRSGSPITRAQIIDRNRKSLPCASSWVDRRLTLRVRTVFWLRTTKVLVFCPINIIITIALHDNAFDSEHLTGASRVPPRDLGPYLVHPSTVEAIDAKGSTLPDALLHSPRRPKVINPGNGLRAALDHEVLSQGDG